MSRKRFPTFTHINMAQTVTSRHNTRSMRQSRSWTTQSVSFRNFDADQKRGMYDLEPEHQRRNVHGREWQQDIIVSSLEFGCIPAPSFHQRIMPNGTVRWESLDGKQRCNAILRFMRDELAVEFESWREYDGEVLFSQLNPSDQQLIENLTIDFKLLNETLSDDEIRRFFQCAQQTKRTTNGEHLNSDLSSPKRKSVTDLLKALSPFNDLMKIIQPNNKRYKHLEIAAELLYCFDTCIDGRETFDVTPATLKKWWKEGGAVLGEEMWREFVSSASVLLQFLVDAEITNKMSKTTFLPIYWYILEHCWKWDTEDQAEKKKRKVNATTLQHVLKSGRDFKGAVSAGSNNGGVSQLRYQLLRGIIEEEIAAM